MAKLNGGPHRTKKKCCLLNCYLTLGGWIQGRFRTSGPSPAHRCAALSVGSERLLSWWLHPRTAPQPGTSRVPKYGGGAAGGEAGERRLGAAKGTCERDGERGPWEAGALWCGPRTSSAARVWRPAGTQRPALRAKVSGGSGRAAGEVETSERCSQRTALSKVRL